MPRQCQARIQHFYLQRGYEREREKYYPGGMSRDREQRLLAPYLDNYPLSLSFMFPQVSNTQFFFDGCSRKVP
jgi:hypothetical protein